MYRIGFLSEIEGIPYEIPFITKWALKASEKTIYFFHLKTSIRPRHHPHVENGICIHEAGFKTGSKSILINFSQNSFRVHN